MSSVYQVCSELLKDVENFCLVTLRDEHLTSNALEEREKLVKKITSIRNSHVQLQQYPQMPPEPSSPPPYLDMKGNNNPNMEYVLSDSTEEHYELCQSDSTETITNLPPEPQNSVVDEPYEVCKNMPVVSTSDMKDALKKGFLDKKSRGIFNQYQKRWCAIKDGILYYFAHSNDNQQCGFIVLNGYEARPGVAKESKKDLGFELVCPGKRTYQFLAPTKNELEDWINIIDKVSNLKPGSKLGINTHSESDDSVYESIEDGIKKINFVKELKDLHDNAKSESLKPSTEVPIEVSTEPQDWYLGKWECVGDDPNELSFKAGDLIRIVSKEFDNHSWWIGDLNGTVGLVPKNFLTEAYILD